MPLTVECQAELIPGYRLIERIGAGGFGEVWKAEAPGGLLKAVKIIHGNLSDSKRNEVPVDQELKALQRVKTVRHPYILSLERFDIIEGRLIIVTELADRTLFDRMKECRTRGQPGIPRHELLRYMAETAEALDLMNQQFNLQHLDIKPQNIFLLFNHVKVGDFGLVKDLEGMFAAITSGLTALYAAPETFEGLVTRYCDQYNLAIVYQEMLTGELPFNGTTGSQLMMQHLTMSPNVTALPSADQPAVARALSKKAEQRFPTCVEFVQALIKAGSTAAPAEEIQVSRSSSRTASEEARHIPSTEEAELPPTLMTRRGNRSNSGNGSEVPPEHHPVFAAAHDASVNEKRPAKRTDVVDYIPPAPPPEKTVTMGDGLLLPALVVGLGGLGTNILREFRTSLRNRGSSEAWPHIRLLSIDTDSDSYERATQEPDSVLSPEEFSVTPFQRMSHYLKRQHEREELQRWLPLNQLSSVARGQSTADGWRALGRLAFVNSQAILQPRLRRELQACTDEKTLTDSARRTSLGLRTTQPRVYVVTSLTGGTGSGMFLDLAALLRRELVQIGSPRAELVAVLLVPPANRNAEPRSMANVYAALRELQHFADAAKNSSRTGPFDRCVFLPLPAKTESGALQEVASLAGDFLCRELITPLGRVADESRHAAGQSETVINCHTFGAYWFSVPRRPLLQRVSQLLCSRLVGSWKVGNAKVQAETVKTWAKDKLSQAKLSSESLGVRLQEAYEALLGQPPKAWFTGLMQRWAKGTPGDLGKGSDAVRKAQEEIEQLLGPVQNEPDLASASELMTVVRDGCDTVAESATSQVAELVLEALIEPQLRLTCTEEAAQEQLGVALEEAGRACRRHYEELRKQAYNLWKQIPPLMESLQAGGLFRAKAKARAAEAIRELLLRYLEARWQTVTAHAAGRLFQNLEMNLHQYRRGVECCHKRVDQFLHTFTNPDFDTSQVDLGLGRYLLPFGCRTMEEAVTRILHSLPPAEEGVLHDNVRNLVRSTLKDQVHVCTAPPSLLRELREQIDLAVDKLAEDSLGRAHAAEVYLERQAELPDADADLAGAFEEAQPQIAYSQRASSREFSILAVPPGPEGERFRALVNHALPDVPMRSAASTNDIIFYREQSFASLDDLPQMSAVVREQYSQVLNSAQFGPHSRIDIAW